MEASEGNIKYNYTTINTKTVYLYASYGDGNNDTFYNLCN